MHRNLPHKTKQFFFVLIKLSIVVAALYFIYTKLTTNNALDFVLFFDLLTENNVFSIQNISFLLILTLFNWLFEIYKWQILVSSIRIISFKEALNQSLSALTASLLTPNRIGDYGAKAMYFVSTYRKRVLLLNFMSNMMQMTITVLFGAVGLYLFQSTYQTDINYFKAIGLLGITTIAVAIFIFGIKKSKLKIKGFSLDKIISFIKDIPTKIHLSGISLSVARYLIFSFQFYFLLHIFGSSMSYFDAMIIISSMYLLASVMPSIFIFDVLIKGSIAVYLFSIAGINEITILCIITLMWILNFVLPSILGSYFVLKFNLPKQD